MIFEDRQSAARRAATIEAAAHAPRAPLPLRGRALASTGFARVLAFRALASTGFARVLAFTDFIEAFYRQIGLEWPLFGAPPRRPSPS